MSSARSAHLRYSGACGVPLPPIGPPVVDRRMPTDHHPEPVPFRGFRPSLTLSKAEVLDVVATLEEVIQVLGDLEYLDEAEELARVRGHLVTRLER